MDAAVMNGVDLSAGAVCGVHNVRNPIEFAAAVMRNSDHVILSGEGANDFASNSIYKLNLMNISSLSSGTINGRRCVIQMSMRWIIPLKILLIKNLEQLVLLPAMQTEILQQQQVPAA